MTFFNQPWRVGQLTPGTEIVLYGKAEPYRSQLQMTNPRLDVVGVRDDTRPDRPHRTDLPPVGTESRRSPPIRLLVTSKPAFSYADGHDAFSDPLSAESAARPLGLVSRAEAFRWHPSPSERTRTSRCATSIRPSTSCRLLQVVLVMRKRAAAGVVTGHSPHHRFQESR